MRANSINASKSLSVPPQLFAAARTVVTSVEVGNGLGHHIEGVSAQHVLTFQKVNLVS